jgi:hypothetical protein
MFDRYNRNRRQRESIIRSVSGIERYAANSPQQTQSAWTRLIRSLGPVGSFLRKLWPGQRPTRDQLDALRQAVAILRPDLAPQLQGSRPAGGITFSEVPPGGIPEPAYDDTGDVRRPERRPMFIRGFNGDPDDPIYRGEMIPVTSSNVHSIGFRWNDMDPAKGTLIVRFLQKGRPGPEYEYSAVHPLIFDAFRAADSKGQFVWDRLRIRGTISGHRFDYKLTGIADGYVPRQAVGRRRPGDYREYFIRRTVTGRNARTGEVRAFESQLPSQFVRRVSSVALFPGGRRVPLVQR